MTIFNKIKGSLFGGAVGDALGFPVEFMQDGSIFRNYGENGITEYKLYDGLAIISDDTQMTLFTAEGITRAERKRVNPTAEDYVKELYQSYLDWFKTQSSDYDPNVNSDRSRLMNIECMYDRRAPGNTCLSALESGNCGTLEFKINRSKGCGGVMRIAPIALKLTPKGVPIKEIDVISAGAAAITHGHDLGYIPAAFLSHVISEVLLDKKLIDAIDNAKVATKELFPDSCHLEYFTELIDRAVSLTKDEYVDDDLDAIRAIGEGWVAEETVAIAIYCALKYEHDFEKAVIAAVNHSGDSDSTGAVTGNIVGAIVGYSGIPEKYLNNLELADELARLAEELSAAE